MSVSGYHLSLTPGSILGGSILLDLDPEIPGIPEMGTPEVDPDIPTWSVPEFFSG